MRQVVGLVGLFLLACPSAPVAVPDAGGDAMTDMGGGDSADGGGADLGTAPVEDAGASTPDLGSVSPADAGAAAGDEECGGIQGLVCRDRNAFCDPPPGTCNQADLVGTCEPTGGGCPEHIDPVCGCDGVSYNNDCERREARVALDHEGRCGAAPPGGQCGGFAGIPCAGEMAFCDHPAGSCQLADGMGECVLVSRQCDRNVDPVCGCDGVTYGNDCHRLRARVQLDHLGACAPDNPDGCRGNRDCGGDVSFCAKATGACEEAGECRDRPENCLAVIDPVCGCDGATYNNSCEAQREGVNVRSTGACRE